MTNLNGKRPTNMRHGHGTHAPFGSAVRPPSPGGPERGAGAMTGTLRESDEQNTRVAATKPSDPQTKAPRGDLGRRTALNKMV